MQLAYITAFKSHTPFDVICTMTSLGFGLTIPNKSKRAVATGPPTRKPIGRKPPPGFFAARDDNAQPRDEDEDDDDGSGIFAKSRPLSTRKPKSSDPSSRSAVNSDLAIHTAHSTSLTAAAEAEAATSNDSNIYEYDSIFDSMKAASKPRTNQAFLSDPSSRKPKYMSSLLAAAEVRKRDQLRAKERMLQKERETEGDQFKDKEKFVTEAYKAQQEELQRAEEEERKREEIDRKNGKGGLSGMYRAMLDRDEERHGKLVEAVAAVKSVNPLSEEGGEQEEKGGKEQQPVKPVPSHVEVNDEGAIVDKRQLLTGGLNIVTKPKQKSSTASTTAASTATSASSGAYHGKSRAAIESRVRQTRMLEEQLEQQLKRSREEEESKARQVMERQAKRGKTDGEVLGARERYLARKKAKEEEEAKGSG